MGYAVEVIENASWLVCEYEVRHVYENAPPALFPTIELTICLLKKEVAKVPAESIDVFACVASGVRLKNTHPASTCVLEIKVEISVDPATPEAAVVPVM